MLPRACCRLPPPPGVTAVPSLVADIDLRYGDNPLTQRQLHACLEHSGGSGTESGRGARCSCVAPRNGSTPAGSWRRSAGRSSER